MTVKTPLESLEEVQAAITAVMGAQEYTLNGRRMTRADLESLTKRETTLLARVARSSRLGAIVQNIGFTS